MTIFYIKRKLRQLRSKKRRASKVFGDIADITRLGQMQIRWALINFYIKYHLNNPESWSQPLLFNYIKLFKCQVVKADLDPVRIQRKKTRVLDLANQWTDIPWPTHQRYYTSLYLKRAPSYIESPYIRGRSQSNASNSSYRVNTGPILFKGTPNARIQKQTPLIDSKDKDGFAKPL